MAKKKRSIPDWLPDWTKPDEYPAPKKTSGARWAWEFLRRNEDYQQDYAIYSPIKEKDKEKDSGRNIAETFGKKYHLTRGMFPDPAWNPPDDIPGRPPRGILLFDDIYGTSSPGIIAHGPIGPRSISPQSEAEVIVRFNLEIPTKIQLEMVGYTLDQLRKILRKDGLIKPLKNKLDGRRYQRYLRLLDAETNGITHNEIAAVIFPTFMNGEKKVTTQLTAARRLKNQNYRFIVLRE